MNSLYHTDYHQWLTQQVTLLRNHNFEQLDLENLLEDLELGIKQDVRQLENYLINLILHLLKMDYQTSVLRDSVASERVIKGWMDAIDNAKDAISRLIIKNHSLKQRVEDVLSESYPAGKKGAIREMNRHMPPKYPKLDNSSFPDTCPWSFDQMMSEDWYPVNGVSLYE